MILDENERPMVTVHVCYSDEEGEVVLSVLRDGGIEGCLNSDVPHSLLPIDGGELGKVEVLVSEDDADDARRVIEEHKASAAGADEE